MEKVNTNTKAGIRKLTCRYDYLFKYENSEIYTYKDDKLEGPYYNNLVEDFPEDYYSDRRFRKTYQTQWLDSYNYHPDTIYSNKDFLPWLHWCMTYNMFPSIDLITRFEYKEYQDYYYVLESRQGAVEKPYPIIRQLNLIIESYYA